VDGAVRLLDCDFEHRRRSRIGVCDCDPSEWLAPSDKEIAFVLVIVVNFVIEGIGLIHVSVCPAVDSDGLNVPGRIKTARRRRGTPRRYADVG
jgi:hypothetical protein